MSQDDKGHVWGPREDSGNARGCTRQGCVVRMREPPDLEREWQRMPRSPWKAESFREMPSCYGEKREDER